MDVSPATAVSASLFEGLPTVPKGATPAPAGPTAIDPAKVLTLPSRTLAPFEFKRVALVPRTCWLDVGDYTSASRKLWAAAAKGCGVRLSALEAVAFYALTGIAATALAAGELLTVVPRDDATPLLVSDVGRGCALASAPSLGSAVARVLARDIVDKPVDGETYLSSVDAVPTIPGMLAPTATAHVATVAVIVAGCVVVGVTGVLAYFASQNDQVAARAAADTAQKWLYYESKRVRELVAINAAIELELARLRAWRETGRDPGPSPLAEQLAGGAIDSLKQDKAPVTSDPSWARAIAGVAIGLGAGAVLALLVEHKVKVKPIGASAKRGA